MKVIIVIGVIVLTAFLLNPYVPNNMDEYSLYHSFACHYYPSNHLNNFRVGCQSYDLKLPFTNIYLPLREFGYMGSILSTYIAPFFLLYPHQIITRIVGLFFLIPQSYLYGKILEKNWFFIFFGLFIFFPYFFQHFVDTGTISIQITILLFCLYLLKKWFVLQKFKYLLLFATFLFLGTYSKLTFLWYIPAFAIYFLIQRKKVSINYKHIFFSSIFLIILFLLLFLSVDRNGDYYFTEFFIDNPDEKLPFYRSNIFVAMSNPYGTIEMIFNAPNSIWKSLFHSFYLFFFFPIVELYDYIKRRKISVKSFTWLSLFIITVFVISLTRKAWSMHHVVLAYPFLILFYLTVISNLKKRISSVAYSLLVLFFVIYNLYFFATFKENPLPLGNERIRYEINHLLSYPELSNEYIYVVVDWGMYYFQSMFGDINQTVLYIEPFSHQYQVIQLENIRRITQKKLLFIYHKKMRETDPAFIINNFQVSECMLFQKSSSWHILFEQGGISEYCNK